MVDILSPDAVGAHPLSGRSDAKIIDASPKLLDQHDNAGFLPQEFLDVINGNADTFDLSSVRTRSRRMFAPDGNAKQEDAVCMNIDRHKKHWIAQLGLFLRPVGELCSCDKIIQ